jgi:hypothetical protein
VTTIAEAPWRDDVFAFSGDRVQVWRPRAWTETALAPPAQPFVAVTAIECASPGSCVANGVETPAGLEWIDSGGRGAGRSYRFDGAGWHRIDFDQALVTAGLSCPTADTCVAVGREATAPESGFVAALSGDTWTYRRAARG